ncbi:hypothetical protein JW930_05440 [Candidatus Woesearchaeota archaeon]|nr:hypothetical protein [Candidatus Woesearchaeota archaeon]
MVRKSKRGSLNLSINAIVVLILAITMLGLGLGFIRGTFKSATEGIGKSLQSIDEGRKNAFLEDCNDDACLEVSSVKLEKNGKDTILLAIYNKLDCAIESWTDGTGTWDGAVIDIDKINCKTIDETASCSDITLSSFETQSVESRKKVLVPLDIFVKNSAKATTYRYSINVLGQCDHDNDPATPDLTMGKKLFLDVVVQ